MCAPSSPTPYSLRGGGEEQHQALVDVALDLPLDQLFTYRVPEALRERARLGHRVVVPFRGRSKTGFVAGTPRHTDLKRVLALSSAPDAVPTLTRELRSLAAFIATYYGCALGEAMAAMVPRGVRTKGGAATRWHVSLVADATVEEVEGTTRSPAQMRILRVLRRTPSGVALAELCRRANVSQSPVRTLERAGVLKREKRAVSSIESDSLAVDADASSREGPAKAHELTHYQSQALAALLAAVQRETYTPFLLFGVTGSGKTEVYLRAIRACVDAGRQAIVLVPEIALTPQTVRRFRARFESVTVLHSGMTEAARGRAWRHVQEGKADVVIGPRSAVFAPLPRLGLVVVDEEHETTFKQQNTPRYHARDVALVRARACGAVVILGTATPSLESYRNAREGKYELLTLPERVAGRSLPVAKVIDLKDRDERPPRHSNFSRSLRLRMAEALRMDSQIILFQNRRGFATSVSCMRCGHVVACPHCDLSLTFHKADRVALCHLCGFEKPIPPACPDCALPRLNFQGTGTQTVENELAVLFPDARVARMDSDTMTTRGAYEAVLSKFGAREIDVLVGTQMIAKGLDFPNVSLVGIVSADTSLHLPDFRASERTFQLIAQVAGRAGRGDVDGRVVIQTRTPSHPAIAFAARHDYERFAEHELKDREQFLYPPFARMLRVVVLGPSKDKTMNHARRVATALVNAATADTMIMGPALPPVARIQDRHRAHVLVKSTSHREVANAVAALRAMKPTTRAIDVLMDVDPLGLT